MKIFTYFFFFFFLAFYAILQRYEYENSFTTNYIGYVN